MVTALDDRDSRLHALQAGAEEFLNKPVDRSELWIRVRNMLRLKEYQNFLADHNRILEEQVAERTRELRDAYKDTIYTMVRAAEFKDEETGAHVQRISFYCRDMAEELGMDAHFCEEIFYASPMHDIGKIAIPDAVLLKPGGFTPEEWAVMRGHAAYGARILERGGSPYTKMGTEIALAHHERWDGTGYPNGTKGEAIPFSARLMNIADQYDALRSKRPYKPAFPHEKAVGIITFGDGRTQPGHFDPQVLDAFGRCAERWREIFDTNAD
jgi:putative two-component system response regulator